MMTIQSEESWIGSSNDMDSQSEQVSSMILKLYKFGSAIQKVLHAFQKSGVQ
jgi:hypothetical protein